MSSYADIARERKRARSLYLELRALRFEVRIEEDISDPTGYKIAFNGPGSISSPHLQGIVRRVRDNKPGLIDVLLCRWDPDLHAIRQEGNCR